MLKRQPKSSLFSPVSFSIFGVIALTLVFYLMYFEWYVPKNEDKIRSKAVRTLNNVQSGIDGRVKHYAQLLPQRIALDEVINNCDKSKDSTATIKSLRYHFDRSLGARKKGVEGGCENGRLKLDCDSALLLFKSRPNQGRDSIRKAIDRACDSLKTTSPATDKQKSSSTNNSLARSSSAELKVELNLQKLLSKGKRSGSEETEAGEVSYMQELNLNQESLSESDAEQEETSTSGEVNLYAFMKSLTTNELFPCFILHYGKRVIFSDNTALVKHGAFMDIEYSDQSNIRLDTLILNGESHMAYSSQVFILDQPVYITGLMPMDEYRDYTHQLSYVYWLVLILLTGLVVVSAPTIKIFVVNTWERLRNADAIISGFGLLALIFFSTLLFVSVFHYKELQDGVKEEVEAYNHELLREFKAELSDVVEIIEDTNFCEKNTRCTSLDHVRFHEAFRAVDYAKSLDDETIKTFYLIDGVTLPYYGFSYNDSAIVNNIFKRFAAVRKRDYISKLASPNGGYRLKNQADKRIYFESVFSYSRGQTEAIVSSKTSDSTIHVVSFDLKSLMLNRAPTGMGYALIDKSGNVVFSSKDAINNFKNLKEDIVGGAFISEALVTQKPKLGEFEYGKDNFEGFIQPVDLFEGDHPFYLVTFANSKLFEWQSASTTLLTFALALSIPLGFLCFLLLNWVFCVRQRMELDENNNHSLAFLFPRMQGEVTYWVLSGLFAIYIIFFVSLFSCADLVFYAKASFTTILVLTGIAQILNSQERHFKSSACVVFAIALMAVSVLVSCFVFHSQTDDLQVFVLFLHALSLLGALLFRRKLRARSGSDATKPLFELQAFLSVFALIVVPIILIFNSGEVFTDRSFAVEAHRLFESGKGADQAIFNQKYANYEYGLKGDDIVKTASIDHNLFRHYGPRVGVSIPENPKCENGLEPIYTGVLSILQSRYSWSPIGQFSINGVCFFGWQPGKEVLLFLIFAVGVFIIMRFYLNKLFFNTPSEIQRPPISRQVLIDVLKRFDQGSIQRGVQFRAILVGPSRSCRSRLLKDAGLIENHAEREYIDLGKNTDWLDHSYSVANIPPSLLRAKALIVRFWQPTTVNPEFIHKLSKLRRYLDEGVLQSKKIVLFSSLSITQLEEEWSQIGVDSDDGDTHVEIRDELQLFLYSFREFTVSIQKDQLKDSKYVDRYGMPDMHLYLNKGYYSPLYLSIWNSLSVEERFILYDIADDSLVNTHNKNTLFKLFQKGLIEYDPGHYHLKIFQPSFAHFIKNGVTTDEIVEMEKLSQKNGSWRSVRFSILLLILLLVGLTYMVNPGILNGVVGVAGIIATTFTAFSQITGRFNLSGLGGMFGGKAK